MPKYCKIKTEDICIFVGDNVNDALNSNNNNVRSFKSFNILKETVSYNKEERGLFNLKTTRIITNDVDVPQIPEFMVVEEVIIGEGVYNKYYIDVITKEKIVLRLNYLSGNGMFLDSVIFSEYDDSFRHFRSYSINGQEANEILLEWANPQKDYLERWAKFINLANTVFEKHLIKKNDESIQTEKLIDTLNEKMEGFSYSKKR